MRTPSSDNITVPDSMARCVIAVAAYFGALFASLEGIGERVGEVFVGDVQISAIGLGEAVESLAERTLAEHPVVGAGFVASPEC